ncbi:MAG: hypothetical protein ABWX70_07750 [Hyphomicrobium sp.]
MKVVVLHPKAWGIRQIGKRRYETVLAAVDRLYRRREIDNRHAVGFDRVAKVFGISVGIELYQYGVDLFAFDHFESRFEFREDVRDIADTRHAVSEFCSA